jgi:Bax protein
LIKNALHSVKVIFLDVKVKQKMKIYGKYLPLLFISLFAFLIVATGCNPDERVKIIEKPIKSAKDIIPITDSLVIPYVYTSAVSLNNLPVAEKKRKFFDMMLPAILAAKEDLALTLKKVDLLSLKSELTSDEKLFIENLKEKYNATNIAMVKSRLHTFPVCIVLAQAAIESAWGTSRFFLEANNPFGLWSFDPDQDRIEASSTRKGTKVYLRKFNNLEDAIDAYFTTLSTGPFVKFRAARLKTSDPFTLINYLIDYSERREAYVEEVKQVITGNNLVMYDTYRISTEYIVGN